MDEHEREVGRRDPAHAARLAERPWPDAGQLLAGLGAEVPHVPVVEALGNHPLGVLSLPLDPLPVEGHIAGVADIVLDLHRRLPRHGSQSRCRLDRVGPGELRPLEQVGERRALHSGGRERREGGFDLGRLGGQSLDAVRLGEPVPRGAWREPAVGVVVPECQPMLRAAGEHPVGLIHAASHEVVDQNADVGILAFEHERLAAGGRERRVGPRHEPLGRSLLIARRAVDLAREKEAPGPLALERGQELIRRAVVIFDGVAIPHDHGPLEAGHHPHHRVLNIAGQARGDPVDVDLPRVPPFGLEKELVTLLVGEANDLVFDARAVPRPPRLDLAGEHRRAMEIGPDEVVDLGRGSRDPADHLLTVDRVGQERERLRLGITRLLVELRKVDARRRQPTGRARLEAVDHDAEPMEGRRDPRRGALPCPAAGRLRLAGMHHRLKERAGGEHDRRCAILGVAANPHARHPPRGSGHAVAPERLHEEFFDGLLPQVEIRRLLNESLRLHLIELLVSLSPRPVHRRPLRAVEHAILDAGGIDRPGHHAAEGVDLADELCLADAADRRIAAHLTNGVAVGRQQGRPRPEPGRRAGRLHPGMAGPDHEHVIFIAAAHEASVATG